MRLYELARELNYPVADFLSNKDFGRFLESSFSKVPANIEKSFRSIWPPRPPHPCLLRKKTKLKKLAKKKPPKLKPAKIEIEEATLADGQVTDAAMAIITEQDSETGAATEQHKDDQIVGKTALEPEKRNDANKLRLGVVGKGSVLPDLQALKQLKAAPPTVSRRKKVKRSLEERIDTPVWEQAAVPEFQPPLPKKVQHETRGSRLQRMQLVYGHELPKKERSKGTEREKKEQANIIIVPVSIRDLSERIGVKAPEVIKYLMGKGMFLKITDMVEKAMAEEIAARFDAKVSFLEAMEEAAVIREMSGGETLGANLKHRPPVIAIMGHVDHGKTTLLDAIRKSNVAAGEVGGITQHIGGYRVERGGHSMTFLDTPGHAAFTAMRARGAKVTDLVVLVVAGNDGVMPQTEEAVNHAKNAGVPILVAVNKMDLPDSRMDKIKEQLAKLGLIPEEWSGHTAYVPVSALKGEGLDQLLEMIHLQTDMLELKADYEAPAEGVVIEARQDPGKGIVSSVLVKNGTLRKGDPILCGLGSGWIRHMFDENGDELTEAEPSRIVRMTGLSHCPMPGDGFNAMPSIRKANEIADERRDAARVHSITEKQTLTMEDMLLRMGEDKKSELNVVIKGDMQGSIEAVKKALEELGNEEARVKVLHKGVGAVAESDVLLAKAGSAVIICFGVNADGKARKLAAEEGVEIKSYQIIYEMIDEINKTLEGMLSPETKQILAGEVEVRQVFRISGIGVIAGSYVTKGYVERNLHARLVRDGRVVYNGKVQSLRRFKDDVKRVEQRYECGIRLDNYEDLREKDLIEVYATQEIQRKL